MLDFREERMSADMVKWHIGGLPRAAVLHQFTGPDLGDPHDHPWGFRSFVLSGFYREQVFDRATGEFHYVDHHAGETFEISATHIHRIVEVSEHGCWLLDADHARPMGAEVGFLEVPTGRRLLPPVGSGRV